MKALLSSAALVVVLAGCGTAPAFTSNLTSGAAAVGATAQSAALPQGTSAPLAPSSDPAAPIQTYGSFVYAKVLAVSPFRKDVLATIQSVPGGQGRVDSADHLKIEIFGSVINQLPVSAVHVGGVYELFLDYTLVEGATIVPRPDGLPYEAYIEGTGAAN